MKLTARQQEVLDYLQSEHRRSGIMPSTREIQEFFGFASQTAAVSHLRALERKGAITRREGDDDRRRARVSFSPMPLTASLLWMSPSTVPFLPVTVTTPLLSLTAPSLSM